MFKRILSFILASLMVAPAMAEVYQGKYGTATTFNFKLYNADGTLDVDEADGGTEVSISCNEGAETTATNDFADEGTFYSIALTAAEMACNRVAVIIAATTTEVFFIQNSGQGVSHTGTAQAGAAGSITLASTASAVDNYYEGQQVAIIGGTGAGQTRLVSSSGYNGTTKVATINYNWATNPDNTSIYEVFQTAPGAAGLDAAGVRDALCSVAADCDDLDVQLTALQSGVTGIDANVDLVLEDTSTTIPGTITTIDNFLDTEIAAILALLDDARTEPGQGAPPVNPDLATKIDYLYKAWRNKSTQTATQYSLYDDAGTTVDQKAGFSDNGTTATRNEIAAGP